MRMKQMMKIGNKWGHDERKDENFKAEEKKQTKD